MFFGGFSKGINSEREYRVCMIIIIICTIIVIVLGLEGGLGRSEKSRWTKKNQKRGKRKRFKKTCLIHWGSSVTVSPGVTMTAVESLASLDL